MSIYSFYVRQEIGKSGLIIFPRLLSRHLFYYHQLDFTLTVESTDALYQN